MPLYDFVCRNNNCPSVGINVEMLCKMGATPQCSLCREQLERAYTAPEGKRVPHISWSLWRATLG